MQSVPEPPPINKGVEITPLLLQYLHDAPSHLKDLIEARYRFGLNKYGQPLMSEDGRNTAEDALQEAGDLLQYLFKGYIRKDISNTDLDRIETALQYSLDLIKTMRT